MWYAESVAALNVVNRCQSINAIESDGTEPLATVCWPSCGSASFLKTEAGFLPQTHDQLDGLGITDITSLVNSVSEATMLPLKLWRMKDSQRATAKVTTIPSLPIFPDPQITDEWKSLHEHE